MENALAYLIEDLNDVEKTRYSQWIADDAGCDLISFMPDDSHAPLIWALQEVHEAYVGKKEYIRRMEVVSNLSKALKDLQTIPHFN